MENTANAAGFNTEMLNNFTKPDQARIRLGIDAKWYFQGPPSGHMVVKNLVDAIIDNNGDQFQLYLILGKKDKRKAERHFPAAISLIFLADIANLLSNLFLSPFVALTHRLDVILFQNFVSLWPRRLCRIAYIHDVLFLDYPTYYSKGELLYFKNMKYLAKKADKIITISTSEKQRLIDHKIKDGNHIAVVYHGVNEKFKPLSFYPQEIINGVNLKYKLPVRYLLFVGRVNPRKNLTALLKALSLLDDDTIPLVITGENMVGYPELDQLLKTYENRERVIFTGHICEEDLYLVYARATVFCYPSYAEGFGLPPLEAMQCGIPVVVSGLTAMPEICGEAAIYIKPDSSADIAEKINELLNNPEFYKQKVQCGLQRANGFKWKKSATEVLDIISNAYAN